MKALTLLVLLQVLQALHGNPIVKNITQLNDFDEVDLSWRLPKAIYPISYQIELEMRVHNAGNREYSGSVIIFLDVKETTRSIVLHSKELNIKDVLISSGLAFLSPRFHLDETRDFLIIETDDVIEAGVQIAVLIEFSGNLQLQGVGFYRSEYKINGEVRYLATTQFEAAHARNAFPVFDGIYDPLIHSWKLYRKVSFRAIIQGDFSAVNYSRSILSRTLVNESEKNGRVNA